MGKVLGTPMHPRESVFLGYSARLWLTVGNDAIYYTLEGDYAMPSENMLYAFENVLNAFEICQKNKSWKPWGYCKHADQSGKAQHKHTCPESTLKSQKKPKFCLLKLLDAGMYNIQR